MNPQDAKAAITLTLSEAFHGTQKRLSVDDSGHLARGKQGKRAVSYGGADELLG